MQHDFTLTRMASHQQPNSLPPDVRELREHIGDRTPRSMQVRRAVSAWLYRLAERVDPRPATTEQDELFASISRLLAEPNCEPPRLEPASHCRC